jgi:hypothetical protein
MALIQLSLPVIVILAFIVFKLNHQQKTMLFKVPVWISSKVLSLGIGHLASGVMGFYGAAFCDLLLYPAMLLVKKAWNRKEKKLLKQKQESGRSPLALPMRPMVVC